MSEKQGTGSDERSPAVSPQQHVPVRFGRGELNAFLNRDAEPPTPDDRTVLAGAEDRPATEDELRALAERLRADRDAAPTAS
jgi:hypothetical protein